MNNKRSQGELFIVLGTLAIIGAAFSFYLLFISIPEVDYIGTNAQKILNTHELKETTFLFLDTSTKFANKLALKQVLSNGGFNTLEFEGSLLNPPICGEFVYPILSNYSCFNDDFMEDVMERTIQILDSLKQAHPLANNVDFSSRVSMNSDDFVYTINSIFPVRIPIYEDISYYQQPDPFFIDSGSVFVFEDIFSNEVTAHTGFVSRSRGSTEVDVIVFHYTGSSTLQSALNTLDERKLSYHYIIDKDGSIANLVPEERSAQHAGCDSRQNPARGVCKPGFNSRSIGISFVNSGYRGNDVELHGKTWESYTEEQYQSAAKLVAAIAKRHEKIELTRDHMYSHGKYFGAPANYNYVDSTGSKEDPGPAFDYDKLLSLATSYYDQVDFDMSYSYAEIFSNSPKCPVPTEEILQRIVYFTNIIDEVEQQHNIPSGIIAGIMMHESCAHPLSLNNYPGDGDGGVGLGHFMAGTAKAHGMTNIYQDKSYTGGNTEYGQSLLNLLIENNYDLEELIKLDDRFNPEKSIKGIASLLKESYNGLNDWDLAILAHWRGLPTVRGLQLPLRGEDLRYINNVKRNQQAYLASELIASKIPFRQQRQIRLTLGVLSEDYSFSNSISKEDLNIYFETKDRINRVNANCKNLDYISKKDCIENIMLEPKEDIFYEKHCIPSTFKYQSFSEFDEDEYPRFLGFVVATHNEKIIDDLDVNLDSKELLLKTFDEEYFIISYEDDVTDEEKLLFSIRDVLEIEGVPPQSDLREGFSQLIISKEDLNKIKHSAEGYNFVASDIKRQLNDCYNTRIDCNCNITSKILGLEITFSENLNLPFQVINNGQTDFTINIHESIYFNKTHSGLKLLQDIPENPNFCKPSKVTYMMCAKKTPDQKELTITNNKIFPFTLII